MLPPQKKLPDQLRERVFIVAEIGKNFIQSEAERSVEEYLKNAQALVTAAKEAGADAVKFQTHHVEDEQLPVNVVSPHFKGADRYSWVTRNTVATPLETFWRPLKQYCDEIGIVFHSTPMSRGAAQKLATLGVELWKVGSGDILDFVALDYLASTEKPIIMSSGMSTLEELDVALDFLRRRHADVILLHCVSRYPCPPEDLNLATIEFLRDRYGIPIGFSDHSIGIDSALAAVALGARVIEKHFSFSRNLWGPDHKVSMTPDELLRLVQDIRELEADPSKQGDYVEKDIVRATMGTPTKILQDDEAVFRPYFRKSLMVGRDIPLGTTLTAEMLYAMRPQAYAGGLPSERYEEVIGRKTSAPLKKYDPIRAEILA